MTEKSPIWFFELSPPGTIGGAESARRIWAHELQKRGHLITTFYLTPKWAQPYVHETGIPYVLHRNARTRHMPRQVLHKLGDLYSEQRPTIIINGVTHSYLEALLYLSRKFPVPPIVQVVHNDQRLTMENLIALQNPSVRMLALQTYRKFRLSIMKQFLRHGTTRFIAVANHVAKTAIQTGLGSVYDVCFPPGLPGDLPAVSHPLRPDPLNVLNVGRIAPEKGMRTFGEVATHATKSVGGTQFSIVGSAADPSYLEAVIPFLNHVKLLGFHTGPALIQAYSRAQVFASFSPAEGMPISLTDALRIGKPVLATDIPAMREIEAQFPSDRAPIWRVPTHPRRATIDGALEVLRSVQKHPQILFEYTDRTIPSRRLFDPGILTKKFADLVEDSIPKRIFRGSEIS
jgi:glycosyltransferase involved in cell wall biosynthesis